MADLKYIVEFMSSKGKIFKSSQKIDLNLLQSRKKLDVFICVDLKGFYNIIFHTNQKSRITLASIDSIFELENKIIAHQKHNNKFKYLLISQAALCSKAKDILKQRGWRVYNDLV